ncbi:MAG: hypothetical protein M3081_11210, partial [Gemmatimonadota bacterium]|nr:hypothetical protein [Gemmatimonadota bacterium]
MAIAMASGCGQTDGAPVPPASHAHRMAGMDADASPAPIVKTPVSAQSAHGRADTVFVSPEGAVRTLTSALALVARGGHVIVRAGVYHEPTIVVSQPVEIAGEGYPTLDGDGAHQIMTVTADDVTVRGIRFAHVGTSFVEDRAALKVISASGCAILDDRFDDAFFAIYLAHASSCRVERNVIHGNAATESTSG